MSVGEAARSQGDIMYRLQELERQVRDLQTANILEAASIGAGGMRLHGGGGLRVHEGGDVNIEDGGNVNVRDGGAVRVTDGLLAAADSDGDVFRVDPRVPEIFMRPELISAVSAQVFADRIKFDYVSATGSTQGTSFGDLGSGSGPTVSNVEVTDTGRVLIMLGAFISPPATTLGSAGTMDVQVSGATSIAPAVGQHSYALGHSGSGAPNVSMDASKVSVIEDLNPGMHTFAAKYVHSIDPVTFARRLLVVIAF